jgi:hypothetical protein
MPHSRVGNVRAPPLFVIGESPSKTSDPAVAFSGRSGARLRRLGLDLDTCVRSNLFPEHVTRWSAPEARRAAREHAPGLAGRRVLFVGVRVARAFGVDPYPLMDWQLDDRFEYAVVPHPSGANRWWNEPSNVETARWFFRDVKYHRRDADRAGPRRG